MTDCTSHTHNTYIIQQQFNINIRRTFLINSNNNLPAIGHVCVGLLRIRQV